ncbi:hypothetical protein [Escherichia coli]|uniref:hypothetical protein n=1 Tax=Escherichia coli TaxID=562 RepID=UPI001F450EDD|nr:hypothetical protein [Escherichia coli]
MLDKFVKSLGFLGVDASNMNHQLDEKNMFKFEDENMDKQWRCFYAFYKSGFEEGHKLGWNAACDEFGATAIRLINK